MCEGVPFMRHANALGPPSCRVLASGCPAFPLAPLAARDRVPRGGGLARRPTLGGLARCVSGWRVYRC